MSAFSFNFTQLDFLLFTVAIVTNIGLGLLIWKYAPRSITRYAFLLLLLSQIFHVVFNYLSFRIHDENLFLILSHTSILIATFYAFFHFFFAYTFLEKTFSVRKGLLAVTALGIISVIITLTPFLFSGVTYTSTGGLIPIAGSGMFVFAAFATICAFGTFFLIFQKYKKSSGSKKIQSRYVIAGFSTTLFLIFTFVFLNFLLFANTTFIPYTSIFTLPFVLLTSYAILRHHFLDIKIFAAEVFAFLIIGISIVQITFVRTATELLFSLTLFILLVIFSMLLIRSMNREVRHRAQEAAYEELQRLDEAKSEFITIASHQLRTPLSGLKGYISMAQEGSYGKPPAKMQKTLGNMAQATERLISLADSFLNVSRMRSGKIELNRQETDLKTFVDAIVKEMRPAAEKRGLNLVWKMPSENLPRVSIDQEKIRTVLMGVLDNAIRYTEKGSINVEISAQPKTVTTSVIDTGKGLTPEELKDVFTSFKRGKTAQALWTEGVGLSLYIAKQLVEAHGGRIWAESKGHGKGSTFFVELPIA